MSVVGSVVDLKTARRAIDELISQAKFIDPPQSILNLSLQALWRAFGERGAVPKDYADAVWAHIRGQMDHMSTQPAGMSKAAVTAMFKGIRENALDKAGELKALRLAKLQPGGKQ